MVIFLQSDDNFSAIGICNSLVNVPLLLPPGITQKKRVILIKACHGRRRAAMITVKPSKMFLPHCWTFFPWQNRVDIFFKILNKSFVIYLVSINSWCLRLFGNEVSTLTFQKDPEMAMESLTSRFIMSRVEIAMLTKASKKSENSTTMLSGWLSLLVKTFLPRKF